MKMHSYHSVYTNYYFWRTNLKQEIDLIEERDGQLKAFEFKWQRRGKDKIPTSFLNEYHASGTIIVKDNFREFVRFQGM